MTHKVGPKGQVVIPKQLRDLLGIRPADEVDFWHEGDHIAVRKTSGRQPLMGRFRGTDLSAELEAHRREDEERDRQL